MGGLISAGAAIVGGLLSKKSRDKQASRIGKATGKAVGQLSPFQQTGVQAGQLQADLLGLGDQEAGDAAFRRFQESTGFQSQLQAGSQAITGSQAARGLLSSGSTLKRLSTFGQDLAKQGFGSFMSQLGGVAGRGLSAAQGAASAIQGGGERAAAARQEGTAGAISGAGQAFGGLSDATSNFTNLAGAFG